MQLVPCARIAREAADAKSTSTLKVRNWKTLREDPSHCAFLKNAGSAIVGDVVEDAADDVVNKAHLVHRDLKDTEARKVLMESMANQA